jgi:hypothetical protein
LISHSIIGADIKKKTNVIELVGGGLRFLNFRTLLPA